MHLFFIMAVHLCDIMTPCIRQPSMEKILWTEKECRAAEHEVQKNKRPFPTMEWATTCTPQSKWLKR